MVKLTRLIEGTDFWLLASALLLSFLSVRTCWRTRIVVDEGLALVRARIFLILRNLAICSGLLEAAPHEILKFIYLIII